MVKEDMARRLNLRDILELLLSKKKDYIVDVFIYCKVVNQDLGSWKFEKATQKSSSCIEDPDLRRIMSILG